MREREVEIVNRLGLHARAAARFVDLATGFRSRVSVWKDEVRVNGKSILGLLTLAASRGTKLKLVVEGVDECRALGELAALVGERFGEDC